MNIDWGAGPAFETEEEWSEWQEKARKICVSHHHACACREARFAETEKHLQKTVSLLQALFDLQNGPPLEKYTRDWNCVMAYTAVALNQIEHDLGIAPVEVERGDP